MAWTETPSYDQVVKALSSNMLPTIYRYKDKYIVAQERNGLYDNAMYVVDPIKHTVELTDYVELIGFGLMDDCMKLDPSEVRL